MSIKGLSANLKFVEMANPHAWLLTADNLHAQARITYSRAGQSRLTRIHPDGSQKTWDMAHKAAFLLGAFALENAIKAFLVYENPAWISNGSLSKRLRSHSLTMLETQASLIPYKGRRGLVLKRFEAGIESWARYPCALSVSSSSEEPVLGVELWTRYIALMEAYDRRMKKLLSSEWHGPHGFYGRWTFEDGGAKVRWRKVGHFLEKVRSE